MIISNKMRKLRLLTLLWAAVLLLACEKKALASGACSCTDPNNPATCSPPAAGTDDCCVLPGGGYLDSCAAGKVGRVDASLTTCTCVSATTELEELFGIINGIMLPIVIIVGMFIIVLAGYKILTSQGNPQELQIGKENLTSAIIGLIFVLMAVSILRVIIKALITGDQDPFS